MPEYITHHDLTLISKSLEELNNAPTIGKLQRLSETINEILKQYNNMKTITNTTNISTSANEIPQIPTPAPLSASASSSSESQVIYEPNFNPEITASSNIGVSNYDMGLKSGIQDSSIASTIETSPYIDPSRSKQDINMNIQNNGEVVSTTMPYQTIDIPSLKASTTSTNPEYDMNYKDQIGMQNGSADQVGQPQESVIPELHISSLGGQSLEQTVSSGQILTPAEPWNLPREELTPAALGVTPAFTGSSLDTNMQNPFFGPPSQGSVPNQIPVGQGFNQQPKGASLFGEISRAA